MLITGDPERATHADRSRNGIPVGDETWRELEAAVVGIDVAEFRCMAGVN